MIARGELRFGGFAFWRIKLVGFACGIGVVNDGDDLARGIGCDVGDVGAIIHVAPVNAHGALPSDASYLKDKNGGERRILFVLLILGVNKNFVTGEALGEM